MEACSHHHIVPSQEATEVKMMTMTLVHRDHKMLRCLFPRLDVGHEERVES